MLRRSVCACGQLQLCYSGTGVAWTSHYYDSGGCGCPILTGCGCWHAGAPVATDGKVQSVAVTMDSVPAYLRGGHIVARKERARRSTAAMASDPITLVRPLRCVPAGCGMMLRVGLLQTLLHGLTPPSMLTSQACIKHRPCDYVCSAGCCDRWWRSTAAALQRAICTSTTAAALPTSVVPLCTGTSGQAACVAAQMIYALRQTCCRTRSALTSCLRNTGPSSSIPGISWCRYHDGVLTSSAYQTAADAVAQAGFQTEVVVERIAILGLPGGLSGWQVILHIWMSHNPVPHLMMSHARYMTEVI